MPVSSSEKRMTIHLKLHAIIDGDGEIVGGGMVTRTCRGGPTIKADIFDTVTARKNLFRKVFNLEAMKPGTRREVV